MIIEPPINEVSQRADCRYSLVVMTSRRARQLVAGAEPLIDSSETKPVSLAVREINQGKITYLRRDED